MLWGSGGKLPRKNDKNGVIWCILSGPKYVINNLNINNFEDNQQPKFSATFFSKINSDGHVNIKINTSTFYKGVWGQKPPEAKEM